jgi:signal peptidase
MYPYLKRGDAIIIEKVDKENQDKLKVGDVVAFEQDGSIVTHRILNIESENEEEKIITKGDNNDTKDVTKKTKDDIIGIVRFKIPLLGYPSVEISEIKKNK